MPNNSTIADDIDLNDHASLADISDITKGLNPQIDYELIDEVGDTSVVDCLLVTITTEGTLCRMALGLSDQIRNQIKILHHRGTITGALGSSTFLSLFLADMPQAILVLGVGSRSLVSASDFKQLTVLAYERLLAANVTSAALNLLDLQVQDRNQYWQARMIVQVFEELAYEFIPRRELSIRAVKLIASGLEAEGLLHGRAFACAMCVARQLADTPPNLCSPKYIAAQAELLADNLGNLSVSTLDESDMSKLGMNAVLSVGRGSREESRLVVVNYDGTATGEKPIVFVGKGVSFDTGGTALKDRSGMRHMKYDMCGAADVLGIMAAVAQLQLPIHVVGICVCAENMPGAAATRPSDVVRSLSGKTVEVLNPDAEGRLLLCDALTYARQFNPELVVDIATLTGASVVALGHHISALFSTDDELANQLSDAGELALDEVWRLPLSGEDADQLKSQYADIANMGDGSAACVVAALFLSAFTEGLRWAHLDISGTAKVSGAKPAATARPVPMLLQFLLARLGQECSDADISRQQQSMDARV